MEEKKKVYSKVKFIIIIILLFACLVGAIFCFIHQDKLKIKKTINTSDINIVDNDINVNKNYYVDDNGNVVSQNLYDGKFKIGFYDYNTGSFVSNSTSFACANDIIVSPSTTYCFNTSIIQWHGTDDRGIRVLFYNDGIYLNSYVNINLSTGVFTTPSNCNIITFFLFDNYGTIYQNDIMLSLGSSALPYEPYGTFVPSTLISNNMFYNSTLDYYFNLDIANPGISHVVGADLLQGDTFLSINQFLHLYFDSNTNLEYTENTNLSYWKLTFNKLFPIEQLILNFDTTQANTFDYYVTYYFDDGTSYIYHNESSSDYYRSFVVDLSQVNGLSGKLVSAISFRRQYSYSVNTISIGSYLIGYNDGYVTGYSNGDSIGYDRGQQVGYSSGYDTGYNAGFNVGYTDGTNADNYLRNVVFACADVPVRVFKQIFSFDVLGINLAGIVLSIMSLFLVIYLVRKLK